MLVQSVPGLNNLFMPQAVRPLVSTVFNYDPYTQSPVESAKLQKMEVSQRAKETTSETARTLAGIYDSAGLNNLVELSPVKIDYLVRNYFGGTGTLALAFADSATSPFREEHAMAAERKLSQTPIIGGFFQNTTGAGVIGDAFDTMERITEVKQTFNDMVDKGRMNEAKAYAAEHYNELMPGVQSRAGAFRQQMGEFSKAKGAIQASPNLTPAEKRDRIDEIQKQMRDFARTYRDAMGQIVQ
jgi:polyhydroxyalkanoate synthesis regulator phasin